MKLHLTKNMTVMFKGQRFTHALMCTDVGYMTILTASILFRNTVGETAKYLEDQGIHISTNQGILYFDSTEQAEYLKEMLENLANGKFR